MWQDAMWIGVPKSELQKWNILEGDLTGRFAYYRCEIEVKQKAKLVINITANSRYRLWVNEQPVLSGPCKGDLTRQYYETVDLSEHLKIGKNIFAVQVLYNQAYTAVKQTDERAGIFGVLTPGGGHRLAVEGSLIDENSKTIGCLTTGKADWRVWLDGSYYLKSYKITENLGAVCEEPDFRRIPADWKKANFDTANWCKACVLEKVKYDGFWKFVGLLPRFIMKQREIPLLYEEKSSFDKEIETSVIRKTNIFEYGEILVPIGEKKKILLDAGKIVNGYPVFVFNAGKDAMVKICYFEKFTSKEKQIRRDDAEHGTYDGITDQLILNGEQLEYTPFWYRTFRFIVIEVESAGEEVHIKLPYYLKTGYPLEKKAEVKSSDTWVQNIWDLCTRTLENCMMETYMDCPYYEQMQFPMDTRLQALFTYMISGDTRLAKKALEDYHCSMTPEGLIPGKYPSAYTQIISTFSLHYIFMLKEYYWQTGELETVRKYFPDIDQILLYYESRIGEDGLVGKLDYWQFVDWQPAWEKYAGVPEALNYGPSTIINLMYCYALQCAAELNEAASRVGMAAEYCDKRKRILEIIQKSCWDEEREMYQEGPGFEQYTCYAQAWAVLNDLPDKVMEQKMLQHAATETDVLKCTFSTSYEWFRACEKAGVYEYTRKDLEQWIHLPEEGCTCCPETPGESRSECHAWSSLPMYELICTIAGIRPENAGWKSVRIEPHMNGLKDLCGTAVTPYGMIEFDYRQSVLPNEQEQWEYRLKLPEGLRGVFVEENGKSTELLSGLNCVIKKRIREKIHLDN